MALLINAKDFFTLLFSSCSRSCYQPVPETRHGEEEPPWTLAISLISQLWSLELEFPSLDPKPRVNMPGGWRRFNGNEPVMMWLNHTAYLLPNSPQTLGMFSPLNSMLCFFPLFFSSSVWISVKRWNFLSGFIFFLSQVIEPSGNLFSEFISVQVWAGVVSALAFSSRLSKKVF